MSDEKNEKDLKYQIYLDERKSLVQSNENSSAQFDKAILTLAAGAIALSITFIDKIAPTPQKSTLIFIAISWLSFIISLLSTLISFLTSQKACYKQIQIIEHEFDLNNSHAENSKDKKTHNIFSVWTDRLNVISITSFIIGVVFLAIFSISNIIVRSNNMSANKHVCSTKKKNQEKELIESGVKPPNPPAKPPSKKEPKKKK